MVKEDDSLFVPAKYFGEAKDVWGCTNESCNRTSRIPQLELKVLDTKEQIMWGRFGDATVLFPMCNSCGKTLSIIYAKGKKNKKNKKGTTMPTAADDQLGLLM